MMAEPGEETAAGHGRLRASHADRERVIDRLKAAFVEGRLTKDELAARVDDTFAARTYSDLAAVTADLPAGLAIPQRPRTPARAQGARRVARPGSVMRRATVAYTGVWALALLVPWPSTQGDSRGAAGLILIGTLAYLIVLMIAAGYMIAARLEKRSGGQLPPRRTQRRQELDKERNDGPRGDLMLCRGRRGARAHRLTVCPAHAS